MRVIKSPNFTTVGLLAWFFIGLIGGGLSCMSIGVFAESRLEGFICLAIGLCLLGISVAGVLLQWHLAVPVSLACAFLGYAAFGPKVNGTNWDMAYGICGSIIGVILGALIGYSFEKTNSAPSPENQGSNLH